MGYVKELDLNQLEEVAKKHNLTPRNAYLIYCDVEKCLTNWNSKVKATYRFPNNMVATFGWDDKQIVELQGVYSKELFEKIKSRSDEKTLWNGF